MSDDRHPAFFGYGSLVNRATHDYSPVHRFHLAGWRRLWRSTSLRPFAFLSAEPAGTGIDGLIAAVPGGDWAALDTREAAYRRHALGSDLLGQAPGWTNRVEVYAVDETHSIDDTRHPILLSYLDTVIQGFLREFGEPGAARFFATTAGWTAILDDRENPIYPRHQALSAQERSFVDRHIAATGLPRPDRNR